jgi:siroheme synthase-like protein
MTGFPIELNLNGRMALVVGLEPVGRRWASALSTAGARVIGVDPDPSGLDPAPVAGLELLRERHRSEHLHSVSLVIAAGPAAVNRRVVCDARVLGIWASSVSDPEEGDFSSPAVWTSGPLTLSVSTGGASPALAAALRDTAVRQLAPPRLGWSQSLPSFGLWSSSNSRIPSFAAEFFVNGPIPAGWRCGVNKVPAPCGTRSCNASNKRSSGDLITCGG